MKRILLDINHFYKYLIYAAKSDLKSEVADSHLNWLWWVLDPLLFMLVYTFLSAVVFGQREQYFPIFVFIGLTAWNFFSKTIQSSVKMVKNNKSIVSKIYIPKYIFLLQKILVNGFKMLISFGLVLIMMAIYRVPLSFRVLYVIPTTLTLIVVTFGFSSFCLHWGVFFEDLSNIISIFLKLMFYFTGIFYSIAKRIPEPFNKFVGIFNPMAGIIDDYRMALLYSQVPSRKVMLAWFAIGTVLSLIGIRIIYKNENNYVKVM